MPADPTPPPAASDSGLADVITTLCRRFPHIQRDATSAVVRQTYAQLRKSATVKAHLIALTQNRAAERLRRQDTLTSAPHSGNDPDRFGQSPLVTPATAPTRALELEMSGTQIA